MHNKDRVVLELIQSFFGGVGSINQEHKDSIQYRISSVKDLAVVIDHFDKFPLITKKHADFEFFKQVVYLINRKEHLTKEGLQQILNLRASINNGLSSELKVAFPNTIPVHRPVVDQVIQDPNWLAGFAEGESNFAIRVASSATGKSVSLIFRITQHKRDLLLMKSIIKFLDCGQVKPRPAESCVDFIVTKFSDIDGKIISFFDKYHLTGNKKLDYLDFCKAAELMKNKTHLTPEGLEKIIRIKAGMNTGRKLDFS
jgi:hypothetical protein